MKTVIIGGVAGGASAAARLRRLDESAEIIIIERTGFVSYANCGLPYYIGGEITEKAKLTLQTPGSFRKRFDVDVRVREEAVSIDRVHRLVRIRRLDPQPGQDVEYTEGYDKLILSPGASAFVPGIPGVDLEGVFTLRTVEDTFAIAEFIEREHPTRAVVVGAGFIGLEMAENLCRKGIGVTMLQRPAHVMPTLDDDMAALVHNELVGKGIELVLRADMTELKQGIDGIDVTYADADHPERLRQTHGQLVILAIGVRAENALAREAGLELGVKGTIVVDEHMRTADPDIYAVGDAVEVGHLVTGSRTSIALAGPANKQGRIAADNIAGKGSTYRGSQGSSIARVFDITVASTGLNVSSAREAGLEFDYVILNLASHASYYPGSVNMTLKALFEKPSGRVLGAQIIGGEGVDKRIDVIATAIRGNMTAWDLAELELAYAPPYSSAKDPVNQLGFVMSNLLDGVVSQIHWDEALVPSENSVILDVRTVGEYEKGHIDGALNIPVDELRDRLDEIPRGKFLRVHCRTGLRSYIACRILAQNGFDCANVAGGYLFHEMVSLGSGPRLTGAGPCGL